MASTAQSRIRSVSYAKYGYMFILPFFLVYCLFQIWPLINTFILSVYGNGKTVNDFIGLGNFEQILFGTGDGVRSAKLQSSFGTSLFNTIILWFGNFIPQLALSLALAVWFTDAKLKIPGKGFFKVIMYMPNIITAASVAALFLKIFGNSEFGVVNRLLINWGFIDKTECFKFVSDPWKSRIVIMFIQTWLWFGNTMIMLMSGIMGLNPSLFEAANIDGASSGQVFRKITLPLLRPIMLYTLITSMIGGLQMFDIPFMYQAGRNTFNEHTKTIAMFIFNHVHQQAATVDTQDYGYSGAASVILFLITIALGSVTFYMNRDKEAIARKKERKANLKALKAQAKGGVRV
jgi:multiple sugar transport system permease protein